MKNFIHLKDSVQTEGWNTKKLHRFARYITNNTSFNKSADMTQVFEDVVTSSFKKICQNILNWNICPRSLSGPPGKDGTKGDKGN